MCGIVGVLGTQPAAPVILDALKRLEYRGYDSAGIATLVNGGIDRRRAVGKLTALDAVLQANPLGGTAGIGHTRWATHGPASENNAHPHVTDKVALVHNGIIENFRELRAELEADGVTFTSETDTEIVAHLITQAMKAGASAVDAASQTLSRLEGAFALCILFHGEEDLMIGARKGSPLAIGYGNGEMYLGSDAFALAPMTNRVAFLEEGDWTVVQRGGVTIYDAQGKEVERPVKITDASAALVGKGNHRHFMAKEIFEQPEVIGHTLTEYIDTMDNRLALPSLPVDFSTLSRVTIVACGTASYAGHVAKYWFEQLARLPVEIDIASEFRYREAPMPANGLAVFVSQSGETADTLAALRYCREQGQKILSIVNVTESSIARESDAIVPTYAGPEIGVASTKAFTCQLTVLALLALEAAKARGHLNKAEERLSVRRLMEVPRLMSDVLAHDDLIQAIAHNLSKARDVLYLGRGPMYPMALEGALKLKEISYIHAEGYAAGELKHGPVALVDENVPVVVIAPSTVLFDKTVSNMQVVMARGGRVILISDKKGIGAAGKDAVAVIEVPECDRLTAPLIYSLPVQLLAYHTALAKGTDVDQPRNLAKSVTVE
ncbi:glucosamine--fructose-6-phosphate aminotransferase [Tepidicaulis marinus]|uniref:Glutamine--fructose-6-phosphate aminotransferase [isomerizing] n=1 Tax=Tepidicaulis marinus TaxID=1333998 RepID=A0A081B7E2_9HYPH|nr:glutamine--fructose-6-phosphate transaminase (isomerizing) [Tepidicaulis marinus]GAK43960.1 glucosamine--fructose-6-phosphate aminotransferase [Tepidicaulis marinus]